MSVSFRDFTPTRLMTVLENLLLWFKCHVARIVLTSVVMLLVFFVGLYLSVADAFVLTSPDATPLLEDRGGRFLSENEETRIGFWAVTGQPLERVKACLLAIEDHRFQQHHGVDFRGLARAMINNLKGGPRQGASTIAMQVARLQNPRSRGYWNKLGEMLVAFAITQRYGREAVLDHYLRIVPQGNRMQGVAYSARRYFQKPLADLSWAEAALLAALPKAPGRFNLYTHSGQRLAVKRANLILDLLERQGRLQNGELDIARDSLARLKIPTKEVRPFHSTHAILRLHQQIAAEKRDFQRPLRTTLDLDLQETVDTLAYQTIEALRPKGAGNIAVMVTERQGGAVLAYLGSEFYADEDHAGAIDYAATPRSSGSTLKPFIYALGLETELFSPASILADLPLNVVYAGGHYAARNYDSSYLGPMLYRRALANSRNIPAIRILKKIGLNKTYEHLGNLDVLSGERPADFYGLGLAIGGAYVTLFDLVKAYGVLANEGLATEPHWFLDDPPLPHPRRLISEQNARLITLFLSDPQARLPSFPARNLNFPIALKTGTSQGFRDAWAVAYSANYVVGVWIGHPDHLEMKEVNGSNAARLVRQILVQLHPEQNRGIGEKPFPTPRGYRAFRLCALSGQAATEHCRSVALEHLPLDVEPAANTVHRLFAIDTKTGELAMPEDQAAFVETHARVVLPPEYATWASRQGYQPPPQRPQQKTSLKIQSPANGAQLMLDPDTPATYQTLALRAVVEPTVPEVIWFVDGQPYRRATYPYELRWPMVEGTHTFRVRFPNAEVASEAVTVTIRN